jgi:hypothetical protein
MISILLLFVEPLRLFLIDFIGIFDGNDANRNIVIFSFILLCLSVYFLCRFYPRKDIVIVKIKTISVCGYIYLTAPIIIFFISQLHLYIGIPASILLIFGLYNLLKTQYFGNNDNYSVPLIHLISILIILFVFVGLTGIGGFFAQGIDNSFRNVMFRDLIEQSLPIVYPENGYAMTYYFLFWLVPVLFGKVFGWLAANIILLFWTTIGMFLTYLFILKLCSAYNPKKMWFVCIGFILFSGLLLPGAFFANTFGLQYQFISGFHTYEWWLGPQGGNFIYRNTFGALTNTYHKSVVCWLVTAMFLSNKRTRTFAFISLCLLPYAPINFIGLLPIVILFFVQDYLKRGKSAINDCFSIPNIMAVLVCIIWFFYFTSNNQSGEAGFRIEIFSTKILLGLILFYIFVFGVFSFLIFDKYKKSYLFWIVIVLLFVFPFFIVGDDNREFCMSASQVSLFILMIMIFKYVIEEYKTQLDFKRIFKYCALLIVLAVSWLDPLFAIIGQLSSGYYEPDDRMQTLNRKALAIGESTDHSLCYEPTNYFFHSKLSAKSQDIVLRARQNKDFIARYNPIISKGNSLNSSSYFSDLDGVRFYDSNKTFAFYFGFQMPNTLTSDRFSIEIICYPKSNQLINADLFSTLDGSYKGLALQQDDAYQSNVFRLIGGNGSQFNIMSPNFSLQSDRWNYIALSIDKIERRINLYLNGSLIFSVNMQGAIWYEPSGGNLYIGNWAGGRWPFCYDHAFNGLIREISVKNEIVQYEYINEIYQKMNAALNSAAKQPAIDFSRLFV